MTNTRITAVMGTVALLAAGLSAPTASAQEARTPPPAMVMIGGVGSYLGVGVAEITSDRAKELNLREERGVEITKVDEDSPASKAGLKVNDVVLEYNGQRVEGMEQFVRFVRETPEGRQVKLLISRGGASQTLMATLGSRKGRMYRGDYTFEMPEIRIPEIRMPDMPNVFTAWRSGMLGIEAESLSPQLAEFFGAKEGVLIRSIGKGTAAEKAGLKAGDVLTKIDDRKVNSPQEVTREIHDHSDRRTFPVTVIRERREMTVSVTLDEPERPTRIVPRGRAIQFRQFEL